MIAARCHREADVTDTVITEIETDTVAFFQHFGSERADLLLLFILPVAFIALDFADGFGIHACVDQRRFARLGFCEEIRV